MDGTAALEGMHVFSGQVLQTSPGRYSDLLTHGGSLRLLSNTKLQFNGDSAELIEGGVQTNTSSQFSVRSGCASVTPSSGTGVRYLVQWLNHTLYVTAEQEEITVKSRKAVHVSKGKTVAVYCAQATQPIAFVGSDVTAKVIMGAAASATPLSALPKSEMSSSSPSH